MQQEWNFLSAVNQGSLLVHFEARMEERPVCPGVPTAPGGNLPTWHPKVAAPNYHAALAALDLDAVRTDLHSLFNSSQPEWPSDYGYYGPFFVRLAWHCSGSYRTSDGRGGCDGGRQRFDPERSWDDNTNLDKARGLLWPIKRKYGLGLSWGDLFILAGTTAVEAMGGPILGFCAGRIDDVDGSASVPLGPSSEQEAYWPCALNGTCTSPLGSTTVGLIYLNPEGPLGVPAPERSAPQIRDTFNRMNMNDTETVALIGGGHAFGKTHGACPNGAGPSPREDPSNPWPGKCGTGKGADAFTSGFEGPWTTNPTWWDNSYFTNLRSHKWKVHIGPGGHHQWQVDGEPSPTAPGPQGGRQDIMMMTSDVALLHDDAYEKIVRTYATDQPAFDHAWKHAWYKLTTRDMGPISRCVGDDVPPAQPWQFPLPPPPNTLANFSAVKHALRQIVRSPSAAANGAANGAGNGEFDGRKGGLLVQLAWRCAATFRQTDFRGGCNGGRIRFPPERDWAANSGWSSEALALLAPVHASFSASLLSWSDLIALAATVAIEAAGGPTLPFCGGRTDAADGAGSVHLQPKLNDDVHDTSHALKETYTLLGLTPTEYVALVGGVRSLGPLLRRGSYGNATSSPATFDNEHLRNLAAPLSRWAKHVTPTGQLEYVTSGVEGKQVYVYPSDVLLRDDPALLAIVQDFAVDDDAWRDAFAGAWTKLMAADRFDGPTRSVC